MTYARKPKPKPTPRITVVAESEAMRCPRPTCDGWLQFTNDDLGRSVERCDCGHRRVIDARAMALRNEHALRGGRFCAACRGPIELGTPREQLQCDHCLAGDDPKACERCGGPIPRTGGRPPKIHERCLTSEERQRRIDKRELQRAQRGRAA